jgi:hypothetical protein
MNIRRTLALVALVACSGGETEPVSIVSEQTEAPASCEAFCGARGYSCTESCTYQESGNGQVTAAGRGSYSSGSDFFFSHAVATCETAVPAVDDLGYTLFEVACCCEIPAQTRIDQVDLANPTTCSTACESIGSSCNPETYWRNPVNPEVFEFLSETSAGLYVHQQDGSSAINQLFGCDEVIPVEEWAAIGYALTQVSCGCE